MSTEFDAYQKKILTHQRLQTTAAAAQTGLMFAQTSLMTTMAGSLQNIQAEMAAIRQLNLNGLAIQQEMAKREQLQNWLEEFIFNAQKIVDAFAPKNCDVPPSARYFTLLGVLQTVQANGIGTALIRGRENKAAFETAMGGVSSLLTELAKDADVKEAITWSEAEDKRMAAEAKRLAEETAARRQKLTSQITALSASRKSPSFAAWYSQKFGKLLKHEPPFDNLPLLSKIPDPYYYLVMTIILWGPLPFGVCYGCVWIPISYYRSKQNINKTLNEGVDRQIAALQGELARLG